MSKHEYEGLSKRACARTYTSRPMPPSPPVPDLMLPVTGCVWILIGACNKKTWCQATCSCEIEDSKNTSRNLVDKVIWVSRKHKLSQKQSENLARKPKQNIRTHKTSTTNQGALRDREGFLFNAPTVGQPHNLTNTNSGSGNKQPEAPDHGTPGTVKSQSRCKHGQVLSADLEEALKSFENPTRDLPFKTLEDPETGRNKSQHNRGIQFYVPGLPFQNIRDVLPVSSAPCPTMSDSPNERWYEPVGCQIPPKCMPEC